MRYRSQGRNIDSTFVEMRLSKSPAKAMESQPLRLAQWTGGRGRMCRCDYRTTNCGRRRFSLHKLPLGICHLDQFQSTAPSLWSICAFFSSSEASIFRTYTAINNATSTDSLDCVLIVKLNIRYFPNTALRCVGSVFTLLEMSLWSCYICRIWGQLDISAASQIYSNRNH